jgi:methylenetetrahydrofolate reductase (NADPH)
LKIGQKLRQDGKSLSFEFFPPKTELGEIHLFDAVSDLQLIHPTFVSVTCHTGEGSLEKTKRIVSRFTSEIGVTTMPHVTCAGHKKADLKNILQEYSLMKIENILVLRGDLPEQNESGSETDFFQHANELVEMAVDFNTFSIGVGVYPEGHVESPDLETDMYYAKKKIDAGADFAMTQMFFDNRVFYDFRERAIEAGIKVPLVAGIMPAIDLTKVRQMSQLCGTKLPGGIVNKLSAVNSVEDARKTGIEITTEQCFDLIKNNVQALHFYALNRSDSVTEIVKNLGLQHTSN